MATPKVFESEYRFCLILWEREPIASAELARLCNERLGWSRTTTYTVLKKMCDRGLFVLEGGTVSEKMTREEFYGQQSRRFVEEAFGGSLPAFVLAFAEGKSMTPEEQALLKNMLAREEDSHD